MENVCKSLDKNVSILLELTAAPSAKDVGIHEKS